ncbi:hypothetical protein BAUCODRAFT_125788 [Baudoinia panamericana UAMH 10762]|uniref:NYN domain-containing protein n=1 Tax=Baudoinia panamericana (strain UAMH 10762) TaxID=717646 RepID=M2N2C4_BAUPA|nr:uncharacterized protein BAUCODRAFT_125788 [Baudoinia panamericana UAMH 10762]EMC92825.1 hypothetical protein BAUCODRAFT_125788 [Baudoinia panamericana UAMH 10762]
MHHTISNRFLHPALINADNISVEVIVGLTAEVTNYGTANLLIYSIISIHRFTYTTGNTATDGAMITKAMHLLYTGRLWSLCLVSSDSDFIRLTARTRGQGVTPGSYRHHYLHPCRLGFVSSQLNHPSIRRPSMELERPSEKSNTYGDDWVNLADVGSSLGMLSPVLFECPRLRPPEDAGVSRNCGYLKTREFVEASGLVEGKWKPMGDYPPVDMVLVKLQQE